MAGNNYEVNYEDPRFGKVESEKSQALTELEQTYGGMVEGVKDFYNAQIDASKQWADKQSQLQQAQTDFAIEQIEQQKEQAQKDYTKEQSGAYTDWKKQSNQFGVEAEQQAAAGMTGTGFSESSRVSMYNTYQTRIASARESYNIAVLNYNNAIKEARLQNNSALAQIALETFQKQLELSLQGFQYQNQLVLDQAAKKIELDSIYHNRYLDVLSQINTELSMAEQIRQYNEKMAEEQRQFNESMAFEREQYEYQKAQDAAKASYGGGGGYSSKPDAVLEGAPTAATAQLSGHLADAVANGQLVAGSDGRLRETGLDSQMNNLGRGPISTGHLADLMANGEVVIGTDGKLKNTSSTTKKTSLSKEKKTSIFSGLSQYFK